MKKTVYLEEDLSGRQLKSEALRDEFEVKAIYILECHRPRLAHAIVARYGFDGRGCKSYPEVGRIIGRIGEPHNKISQQNSMQIIFRALRWLRQPWNMKYLNRFLD